MSPSQRFIYDDWRANQCDRFTKIPETHQRRYFEEALAVARQQVDNGANMIDVNFDEGLLDGEASMTKFLNLIAAEPDISRVPIVIDSSMTVLEAGLKVVQGKSVELIGLKEGEENSYDKLRFADGILPQSSLWHSMKPASNFS